MFIGIILTPELLLKDYGRDDFVTVVIVICGWNNVVRGKNRNTGHMDMKLRQLQLLEHKYIIVSVL